MILLTVFKLWENKQKYIHTYIYQTDNLSFQYILFITDIAQNKHITDNRNFFLNIYFSYL